MTDSRTSVDGLPHDGVGHDLATADHLAAYEKASQSLSRFHVPVLIHSENPHEKLIVVAFDGTGNNKFTDPKHATNVAKIHDEIEAINHAGNRQIYARYVEGPGTQEGSWASKTDSALGHSYEENIRKAYTDVVRQANKWMQSDPEAAIRVHSIGFSRGGSQAAGFTRYLDERGIPELASEFRAADGSIGYSRLLVEPGKTIQSVGLFDPVATGVPMRFDRRLPPSVVSGFQITSSDELRATFPSDQIIRPGLSEDGRFLNVMVPGAHSDVGGGYQRDGLSIRCGNLMRDYCNALSDKPYLQKEFEPTDERYNVLHRSSEGKFVFRADPRIGVRGEPSGTNERLAPRNVTGAGDAPHRPEAVSAELNEGLVRRRVLIAPGNMESGRASIPSATAEQIAEAGKSVPFGPTLRRVVGGVATVADVGHTAHQISDSIGDGNMTAATSQGLHFASRNVGGWAGAEVFGTAAAAAGVESGPGLFVAGAVGMTVGFIGGGRIGDEIDQYRINHQSDTQGNTWRSDEKLGWIRDIPPLPESPQGQRLIAGDTLSSQLSYQAANTATELALAKEYSPRDPFTQPAAAGDTPSLRDAPWTRDPQTHQWSRHVVDGVLEHGMTSSHMEVATPQRASDLELLAKQTVQRNAAESPIGVAQRYASVYEQNGWMMHGPMPEAVHHALAAPTDKILASDGKTYTHGKDGEWSRPGMIYGTNPADARTTEELNLAERTVSDMKRTLPTRLDDPAHPDNVFFKQVQGHVAALDRNMGRTPDQHTDQIASALTVQARADGLKRVDQVALSTTGEAMWAVQTPPGRSDHLFDLQTKVPTAEANTPMEQSAAKWPEAMQQFQGHEQAQQQSQQRAMDRQQADTQTQGAAGPSMAR
ncbi:MULTISPECIES: T6SS phospholipase effector Tle1-like catalytic domain-containing protein [Luteibacter]|uniref:T6SS phospholipase effector Tle1-like catalytic domain-containing protein n=1 Tax=Luteibacter TaxID=242605 RepID=UPI0006893B30|nr:MULTISPECIES: DUF2235 domain-containing protein [unclassified Luteibacter]